jgi:hypothetical protein
MGIGVGLEVQDLNKTVLTRLAKCMINAMKNVGLMHQQGGHGEIY